MESLIRELERYGIVDRVASSQLAARASQDASYDLLGELLRSGRISEGQADLLRMQHRERLERACRAGLVVDPLHRPQATAAYEVLDELGRGGMGLVQRVRDRRYGREVALKTLFAGASWDANARFLREARVMARLEHPNIPPVYEFGRTASGDHFLVMPIIRGETLAARIKRYRSSGELSARRVELVEVLRKVCDAVDYAHSQGILHRDLKPGNIMVGAHGEVLVLDWGLARDLNEEEDDALLLSQAVDTEELRASGVTVDGAVLGTPGYMPPEQANGEGITRASDIFSLGAIFMEALTGARPIDGTTVYEVLAKTVSGQIQRPRDVDASVPAALDAIAAAALASSPSDRIASAAALSEELEAWMTRAPLQRVREPMIARLGRRVGALAGLALSAIVIAAASLLVALAWAERGRAAADAEAQRAEGEAQRAEVERLEGELGAARRGLSSAIHVGLRARAGSLSAGPVRADVAALLEAVDSAETRCFGAVTLASTGSLPAAASLLKTPALAPVEAQILGIALGLPPDPSWPRDRLLAEARAAGLEELGAWVTALDARVDLDERLRACELAARSPLLCAEAPLLHAHLLLDAERDLPRAAGLIGGLNLTGPLPQSWLSARAKLARVEGETLAALAALEVARDYGPLIEAEVEQRLDSLYRLGLDAEVVAWIGERPEGQTWSFEAMLTVGAALEQRAEFEAAGTHYLGAIGDLPQAELTLLILAAQSFLAADRPDRAREVLARVDLLDLSRATLQDRTALADIHRRLGDPARCNAILDELLRVAPGFAAAQYTRGLSASAQAAWRRACASFEAAVSVDPQLAAAHSRLAVARFELGDAVGALAAAREALRLKPDDLGQRVATLKAEVDQGPTEATLDALSELLAKDEVSLSALALRGLAYARLGRTEEAHRDLATALASAPAQPSARLGLARLALAGGAPREAIDHAQAARAGGRLLGASLLVEARAQLALGEADLAKELLGALPAGYDSAELAQLREQLSGS